MRRLVGFVALVIVGALVAAPAAQASSADPNQPGAGGAVTTGSATSPAPKTPVADDSDTAAAGAYPGDPEAEATLVAAEDRRLVDVNLVSKGILVPELDVTHPFRVTGTAVSTLVLTARKSPYTLEELAKLVPSSVVKGTDGVYDINESIAVLEGATLDIHGRGKLELRLASQPDGFVSIVTLGGTLVIRGDASKPAVITSWNALDGVPDTVTSDGRSYIRAMGGQVSLTDATFKDLGFWSGVTGGIALTGLVQTFGLGLAAGTGAAEPSDPGIPSTGDVEPGATPDSGPVVGGEDGTDAQNLVTTTDTEAIDQQVGDSLVPEGVTAYLSNLHIDGNAFGIFAANVASMELHDSVISNSLVDGVVFHRQVEHSSVENTSSNDNVGDGFRISRGSDAIKLQNITANGNGRNGVTINASPLATGPSAVGLSTDVYGSHMVSDAVLTGNGSSGITVIGGDGVTLSRNRIESSPFGIVVQGGTQNLRVELSTFEHIEKQSIALRDGVGGVVTQNTTRDGKIGVYVRDSVIEANHNTISGVHGHGITVVGEAEGTVIDANVISGAGSSPIDTARAENAQVTRNNVTDDWVYQSLAAVVVDNVKRPLTLMWVFLATLLAFTAISGFRQRKRGFGSPYRDRTPLSQYSRGLVDPSTVPGAYAPLAMRRAYSQPKPTEQPLQAEQTVGATQAAHSDQPKRPELPKRQSMRQDQTVGV